MALSGVMNTFILSLTIMHVACSLAVLQVYDCEEDMMVGLERKEIKPGMVVVIRYEGPKGGPGMPEMLTPTR